MGGGDKPLLRLGDRPIIDNVIERLQPQVSRLAISANGDPSRYAHYGLPVIEDDEQLGPLAGVLAGMEWAIQQENPASHLITVSGDTPFLPLDLVLRLELASEGENDRIVLATSGGRRHPTVCRWPVSMRLALKEWLTTSETYQVLGFIHRHDFALADFHGSDGDDPFFNINTPEDLERARDREKQMQLKQQSLSERH
ncbi:molybdenum cofactor guanylyltransferase MobA [Notoacmeibacter sp. MSK16QG-6]|nr:molybdenum cofactor guanylyltransferase MobA [Notoacmeibacter sp. MSK16QG-6]